MSSASLWLLCGIMLCSMCIYPIWNNGFVIYGLILLFFAARLFSFPKKEGKKQIWSCILCLLMYALLDLPHIDTPTQTVVFAVRHVGLVWMVILLSSDEKSRLVKLFTAVFSTIVAISLLFYILYLAGANLSYCTLQYKSNVGYPLFRCYYFLITAEDSRFFVPRFQSVFLEPGHLGMVAALLLYINGYKLYKPSNIVIFVAVLLSLSLAAYILLAVGVILHRTLSCDNVAQGILACLAFFVCFVILAFTAYLSNPQSAFSKGIVERLDYNENRGFQGNNRTTSSFDVFYSDFFRDNRCVLGIGNEFGLKFGGSAGGGNCSYKTFIVQYGLLGLTFTAFFFVTYTWMSFSKLLLGLLLLYTASFWQRPYALWEVELFLFISFPSFLKKSICHENKLFHSHST